MSDESRFNGAGDDLHEKHATENELRSEVLRLTALLEETRSQLGCDELSEVPKMAEWAVTEIQRMQNRPTVDVHAIIERMQDECIQLGPCTDDMPCHACTQLARLDGELRGRGSKPASTDDDATVVLLRELRSMAEEGALFEIRKRIKKALSGITLPVVASPLREELRGVLTLPADARPYQYQRAITRALDILDDKET